MQGSVVHSQRIRELVSRHLVSGSGGIDQVEHPVLMELVAMTRHHGLSEVLNAVKEPLKHGVPEVQRRVLTLIDRLVLNTPPEFALCLATDDWAERLFRTTKTTAAPEVADRVMVLVLDWHKRYPVAGLRLLVERFERSKVVGDRFRFIKHDFERRRQQQEQQQHLRSVSASAAAAEVSPSHRRGRQQQEPTAAVGSRPQRVNLDTLLADVQDDMADLEYGIQHPDMLDAQMARDCAQHHATLSRVVDNPANVSSDDEREQALLILEQLVNLLSFHDALIGTKFATGLSTPSPPPRQQQQQQQQQRQQPSISAGPTADAAGETAATAVPDDNASVRQWGSLGHRQTELDAAKQRGDALAAENAALEVKLRAIDAERTDLLNELKTAEAEIENLREKYSCAKSKNKEAVAAVEELDGQLADALERISTLEGALRDHRHTAPPVVVREVVRVVKQPLDPRAVQRIRDTVQSLKHDTEKLRRAAERTFGPAVKAAMVADMVPLLEDFLSRQCELHAQETATLSQQYKREVLRRKEYYHAIQGLKATIRDYCARRKLLDAKGRQTPTPAGCSTCDRRREVPRCLPPDPDG